MVILAGVGVGLAISSVISPDMADLAKTRPERIIRNSLGRVAPVFLWPFWILQARTRHRSIISHSPVGTAIRLLLILPLLVGLWFVFGGEFTTSVCLGVAMGDGIHVALDGVVSWLKRGLRRLSRV